MSLRVLVVDDERISRETTTEQLRDAGYTAEAVENAYRGLQRLEEAEWDVVLTDWRMSGMDGLEFLEEIKKRKPEVEVILMTAYGTVEAAVKAMHQGAADFLSKPFSFGELHARLLKLQEHQTARRELRELRAVLGGEGARWGLVGRSPAMRRIQERIELFAARSAPVLVTGESGTGKELVARALHVESPRSRFPLVAVACGAIPRELAESEIFGHEKGAFTGAAARKRGSLERAHRGTLLLDDVDDLPLEIQVKLLRALQEGTLSRVGAEEELQVDVRIVATTKTDLAKAVEENHFRADLFYRLRGLEIHLPPLRERRQDIPLLAQHFLRLLAHGEGEQTKSLAPEALTRLLRHDWPGNIRELRRCLESSVAVSSGKEIKVRHLPDYLQQAPDRKRLFTLHLEGVEGVSLKEAVRDFEEELLRWALESAGGEQQRAAELLDLPRTTLQSKLKRQS